MEDLMGLNSEEKGRLIKEGRFFQAAPEVAIKSNGFPVLVKATSGVFKGFFSCKALGPDRSGEVTVQLDRVCEPVNILAILSDTEAAMLAGEIGASAADQIAFLQ
ncbi:MAG: hypothetical protein A3J65_01085 [Candidatus Buchananbacteria bacterium RIFCSPHIGHO2_02_FULL_45_11b]|uniref:Uncharacterized protein n=1 Tax=Candidatus Buchananbacteria bacterium RIFCSPHIGHO2_02_FULL_45_11b TaxID=1797541 RepID=A0A1G1YI57_9BACT|nr:MAG: hypothetical protein A3J65_01085 [Candidatus Buchananbacteria bacterium RIFCSPHIGHO2_02_FULL_45_11b]